MTEASIIGWAHSPFGKLEAELICSPDPQFRFHSGLPVTSDSC